MRDELQKLFQSSEMADKIIDCYKILGKMSTSFMMRKFKIDFYKAKAVTWIIEKYA